MDTKADKIEEAKKLAVLAVSRWRDRIQEIRGWKANRWAKEAEVSATTITRSMAPDSASTAKLETLHLLARGARVPSVIDYLDGRAVSVAALRPVLAELLPLTRKGRWTDQDVEHLAQALEYGLGLQPGEPTSPANLDVYGQAARAAADRFRDIVERS